MKKAYVRVEFKDMEVNLGSFSQTQARDYLKKGRRSALWRIIQAHIDTFYPSSEVDVIRISGSVQGCMLETYKPRVRNVQGYVNLLASKRMLGVQ